MLKNDDAICNFVPHQTNENNTRTQAHIYNSKITASFDCIVWRIIKYLIYNDCLDCNCCPIEWTNTEK